MKLKKSTLERQNGCSQALLRTGHPPSFVVDSTHKDLLGRPVRDYRYVSSQTDDVGWPSPLAEAALARAQRAALLSTGDCVWGFTQIRLNEAARDLCVLACRRGLLRPFVLYFGSKQGPGISNL